MAHAGIRVPGEVSEENILSPIPPDNRTEEFKTIIFFDTSTTGKCQGAKHWHLRKTRQSTDFADSLSQFISRYRRTDLAPVTELSFVVITREDFLESTETMKELFIEQEMNQVERPDSLATLKIRAGLDNITRCVDPNVTEEEGYQLYLQYGPDHPQRYERQTRRKFSTKSKAPFDQRWKTIRSFIDDYPKPAVIVGHNAMHHDFRVLYGELLRYNLLDEGLPKGVYFSDSMFSFMNIEDNFIRSITKRLYQEVHQEHPWPVIRQEEESIALKKRILKQNFVEYRNGKWGLFVKRYEQGRYELKNLYRQIVGKDDVDFHWSQHDACATLQVALAYGHKFLDYIEETAAPFPF